MVPLEADTTVRVDGARPEVVEDDGEGGGVAVEEEGAAHHRGPLREVGGRAEHGRNTALGASLRGKYEQSINQQKLI